MIPCEQNSSYFCYFKYCSPFQALHMCEVKIQPKWSLWQNNGENYYSERLLSMFALFSLLPF